MDFVTGASGVPREAAGAIITGNGATGAAFPESDGALSIAGLAATGRYATGEETKAMSLAITSTAFAANGTIPALYTCEGNDISPPLAWTGLPAGTKSLALIVDDPDAPDPAAPKMTWVHWVLYDIPPTATGLAEAVKSGALPSGAREARNDFGRTSYGGPCPPIGRHRYFFKLYALDTSLAALSPATKASVEQAMQGHVLAQATLLGTYQKTK